MEGGSARPLVSQLDSALVNPLDDASGKGKPHSPTPLLRCNTGLEEVAPDFRGNSWTGIRTGSVVANCGGARLPNRSLGGRPSG